MLKQGDNIINDQESVCNMFNKYFSEVACDIGTEKPLSDLEDISDICQSYNDHSSIKMTKSKNIKQNMFTFHDVSVDYVETFLKRVDVSKATGYEIYHQNYSVYQQVRCHTLLRHFLINLLKPHIFQVSL